MVVCISYPKHSKSMADTTVWGTLPKAQDNATTIDSEISAAIAAHNADPDAHTATGQALDLHRVNEVLDHPAGSIVSDKFTGTSNLIFCNFETLAGWAASAGITLSFPGLVMQTSNTIHTTRTLSTEAFDGMYGLDFSKNSYFQITGQASVASADTAYFGIGDGVAGDEDLFFGFSYASGQWSGQIRVGSAVHLVSITIPAGAYHFFRAYVDPATHDAIFEIDGEQVGSIASSVYYSSAISYGASPAFFSAAIYNGTATNRTLSLANLIVGSDQ